MRRLLLYLYLWHVWNHTNYLGKNMSWRGRKLKNLDGVVMEYDYNGLRVKKGERLYFWQSGNLQCRYIYDAWGNHVVLGAYSNQNDSADFIGNINPIRYRSYYWNSDFALYYLQSRYYDPALADLSPPIA